MQNLPKKSIESLPIFISGVPATFLYCCSPRCPAVYSRTGTKTTKFSRLVNSTPQMAVDSRTVVLRCSGPFVPRVQTPPKVYRQVDQQSNLIFSPIPVHPCCPPTHCNQVEVFVRSSRCKYPVPPNSALCALGHNGRGSIFSHRSECMLTAPRQTRDSRLQRLPPPRGCP